MKKVLKVIYQTGAALLLGAFIYFYFIFQPNVELIIDNDTPVYENSELAEKRSGKPMKIAKKGERLKIVDCYDMKSYFVLCVQVRHGQKGYVLDGDYRFTGTPQCS